TDTDTAARAMAAHLGPDAVVVSLQNGVDNVERIRVHLRNRVLPGLVYVAAEMAGPGHVRHTGGGNLTIGETDALRRSNVADRRVLEEIAGLFAGTGIKVTISEAVE